MLGFVQEGAIEAGVMRQGFNSKSQVTFELVHDPNKGAGSAARPFFRGVAVDFGGLRVDHATGLRVDVEDALSDGRQLIVKANDRD